MNAYDALSSLKHPLAKARMCLASRLAPGILALENKMIIRNFKFGVGCLPAGCDSFAGILENQAAGTAYELFLAFLGKTTSMLAWTGYRGGLDTKDDRISAVYNRLGDNELIFHVSHLLPYTPNDTQQVRALANLDAVRLSGRDTWETTWS